MQRSIGSRTRLWALCSPATASCARSGWRRATNCSNETSRTRELAQEADQLTFALEEIDRIAPTPGEDREIVDEVRRLGDLDSLRSAAEGAQAALAGVEDVMDGGTGALDLLG